MVPNSLISDKPVSGGWRLPRAPPPDQPLFKFSSHLRPIKIPITGDPEVAPKNHYTLIYRKKNKESEKTKKK